MPDSLAKEKKRNFRGHLFLIAGLPVMGSLPLSQFKTFAEFEQNRRSLFPVWQQTSSTHLFIRHRQRMGQGYHHLHLVFRQMH